MSEAISKPVDERSGSTVCCLVDRLCKHITDPEIRLFAPLWHGGELIVTDGRILIVMQDQPAPELYWLLNESDQCYHPPKTGDDREHMRPFRYDALHSPMKHFVECNEAVPSVDGPPEGTDELWQTIEECDRCWGRGWRECDMGHEHDCDECDGEGERKVRHPDAEQTIDVLGKRIARRYWWIVSQLPGVKCASAAGINAVSFSFDGGKGLVMAMRH